MEKKIIHSRLDGYSFEQQSIEIQKAFSNELMLAVAAITGCNLPNTDSYADIASALLFDFLNNYNFSHLTFSEILLAFKLNIVNGLGDMNEHIAFSGGNFNITYVAQVLKLYLKSRSIVDRKIKNHIDD